ncbi:hypothetical protein WDU94_012201 [Cyamophila willieti]
MKQWSITINLQNETLGQVNINKGIFQGDGFSSLWFCLGLNPLSMLLEEANLGFRMKVKENNKISHLMYVDDIKLFAENENDLTKLINITKLFSDCINMKFGLKKCAIINIKKGKVSTEPVIINGMSNLEQNEQYKYLGILENNKIDHMKLKSELKEEYRKRVTKLLNTLLNERNMIQAINTWAVPALTYSFGVIKWNQGGRGLSNIKALCMTQEMNMKKKLNHEQNDYTREVFKCDKKYTPLNLSTETEFKTPMSQNELKSNWMSKPLHGKYPTSINNPAIDKKSSLEWNKIGYLHPETHGFVSAIQDKVIRTRNYEKHVMKMNDVIDVCRKCKRPGESIEHVMNGCPMLAENVYLGRHNQVAKLIYLELTKQHQLLGNSPPYYKYSPSPVLEQNNIVLYWDRPILSDRSIAHNRPDIIMINKREKYAYIIDIAVPLTHNITKTEAEKITKYEDLKEEIKRMWKLNKVDIVPIFISSEGVISKSLAKHLKTLNIKKSSCQREMQKAALLQTAHLIRKFLN